MTSSKIICNACFIHPDQTRSNLHLTECGHVFCNKCLSKFSGNCSICGANGIRTLPLSSATIRHLFVDVPAQLENLRVAVKFQQCQLAPLLTRIKYVMKQYNLLKTLYWQKIEQRKRMIQEFQELEKAVNALLKKPEEFSVNELPNNQRMNFGRKNVPFGCIQQNRDSPNRGPFSDDSDASGSTIRGVRPLSKQNGAFRVPTATRTKGSDEMSIGSSRALTPMSNLEHSNGRGSNSRRHFHRHT